MKHSVTVIIASVALIGLVVCLSRTTSERAGMPPPRLAPQEAGGRALLELGEEVEGREDWFYAQRAYPFDAPPAEARQRAWESRPPAAETFGVTPAALTWRAIGPSPTHSGYFRNWGHTSGRVNAVAVSPADDRVVLIGAGTGGIWRSVDGGASFAPVSDDHVDLAVSTLVFSQSDPRIVYAGMGDIKSSYLGTGVLKSTNGGRDWARVSDGTLPAPGSISRIAIDPADPNRVYVAQYTRLTDSLPAASGIYLSTNGGRAWARTFTGSVRDVVIDPFDARLLYAGVGRFAKSEEPPAGLYRSTDRGLTWATMYASPYDQHRTRDVRLAPSPVRRGALYLYMGGWLGPRFDVRLLASADGGQTWDNLGTSGFDTAQFGYNTYIVADPTNADALYIGSRDLFRSTDAGRHWENLTESYTSYGSFYDYTPGISKTHPDQHGFALSPADRNTFYLGNDGGVYKTTDGGRSFASLNASLTLTQFVSLALHPTDPAISYGGSQDNGTQRRLGEPGRWLEFATGDGGKCVINPADPRIVFTSYIRGTLFKFSDNGRSYDGQIADNSTFQEPDAGPRIAFYPPFVGNGVDATLYLGSWRLFVSTDQGGSWSAPGGATDLTKGVTENFRDVLSVVSVARGDKNIIYTGSSRGRAMVTTDGGVTWRDITAGLPDRFISGIAVSPTDPAAAYLTVSGFGTGHVFRTTDMGMTWADVSGNLPDIPVGAILIDPIDSNTLYLGTDIGVFRSQTGGSQWQSFNNGMPPVVVTAFSAQAGGLIQAATYGRGAFEIDVGGNRPAITSATFDGNKKLTIAGARFGGGPRVLINGTDRSSRIRAASDATIKLKGRSEQLGLQTGDNLLQIITSDGTTSAVYRLRH